MEFKTGIEGENFETIEMVNCPVLAASIKLEICRAGGKGNRPCNYRMGMTALDRGKDKQPKKILTCSAPRSIPIIDVLSPNRDPVMMDSSEHAGIEVKS